MLTNVAVAVCDDVPMFELGVACEVFGLDRSAAGLPRHDFAVCAVEPPPLRTDSGFVIDTRHGVERLASADLIIVPGWRSEDEAPPAQLLEALRAAVARGARVMSFCTGAFVLAAAGLLDGRCATTHWMHADGLRRRYPRVCVDPEVLYIDADPVYTSAGTAAGIDLALYLVRKEYGAAVANAIARRMVVPAHREGGQAQYIETPVVERRAGGDLSDLMAWALANLHMPLTNATLAARAHMSTRTFARQFLATTGTSPHTWVLAQRVLHAERLLEDTDLDLEEVARQSGFGSAAILRHHFVRRRGNSPLRYRQSFRCDSDREPATPEAGAVASLAGRSAPSVTGRSGAGVRRGAHRG